MATISIFTIGYSIITALTLFAVYLIFLRHSNKSWYTISSCGGLLGGLCLLQLEHYGVYASNSDPLSTSYYRFLVLSVPPFFYFFSRAILFPERKPKIFDLCHFLLIPLAFLAPREITVPIAFSIGLSYCVWLISIVFKLRGVRRKFEIVLAFCGLFVVIALISLVLAFSASYVAPSYFYHFYTNGIAISLVLVTGSLIVFPNLLLEIGEVVRLGYANSTLKGIDIDNNVESLNELMKTSKMYQNEDLSLAILAEEMGLSAHQLSELINTHFGVGFSKYIRQQRIEAAKRLLSSEPGASVLSISMEVGFKSQSNFYAAFKEITGDSPGNYRKSALN